jgi:hypothetical protein
MVIQMTNTFQFFLKSSKIGLLILVEANLLPNFMFNFSNYLWSLREEYDMFCLVVIIDLQIMWMMGDNLLCRFERHIWLNSITFL